ncbi:MAG: SUMF1/EgtB/PvdO family nonheme iron enzyme [Myxococcota bacterium]|nr:SUMF1/EgtB/PvdO family nonheme iron enzyme [Myxococcota bacterium]
MILILLACPQPEPVPEGMVEITDPTHREGRFYIDTYEFPNQAGVKPTSYTNLLEAAEACEGTGRRLCTAAEWRRACLGPEGINRFAYGPNHTRGLCHNGASLPSGHSSMMDPEALIIASGDAPGCATPEGVYDLVGNLEEWVLDDWRGIDGMLEGGAWYTFAAYADCTGRYSREPDYRLTPDRRVYSAGFRCCWSEETPSAEDIAADSVERLARVAEVSADIPYDTTNELPLGNGVFMDAYEYPNQPGKMPRVGVSWEEASGLCQAEGRRLCETQEWEQACGGEEHWHYPYGKRYIDAACPVAWTEATPAGSHIGCTSPLGVSDLVGGVWEWTATQLDAPVLTSGHGEVLRELRGGSWFTDPTKGTCAPDDGYPAAPQDAAFPMVGFRCCRGTPTTDAITAIPGRLVCPSTMVAVGEFCIDTFEFPNRAGNIPTANMTFQDATNACTGRGLHVCTETEWEEACSGEQDRRWPYGNTYDKAACHDLSESATEEGGYPVGSGNYRSCTSPEGVFDLSGNLWEWVALTANRDRGVLRGGGWNLSAGLNQCRARAEAKQQHSSFQFGTRCCGSAEEIAEL